MPRNMKRLWYVDPAGALHALLVKTGATDGFTTEIHPLHGDIDESAKLIVGITKPQEKKASNPTSPFAGAGGNRGGGRRMGF